MTLPPNPKQSEFEATEARVNEASDKYHLWGLKLDDGSWNTDEVAYVNDVLSLAFKVGATWQRERDALIADEFSCIGYATSSSVIRDAIAKAIRGQESKKNEEG